MLIFSKVRKEIIKALRDLKTSSLLNDCNFDNTLWQNDIYIETPAKISLRCDKSFLFFELKPKGISSINDISECIYINFDVVITLVVARKKSDLAYNAIDLATEQVISKILRAGIFSSNYISNDDIVITDDDVEDVSGVSRYRYIVFNCVAKQEPIKYCDLIKDFGISVGVKTKDGQKIKKGDC